MDGLADTMQDLGLAQLIQNGLEKSKMTKPAAVSPEELDGKKGSATLAEVQTGTLGPWLLSESGVGTDFEAFKATKHFELFCKYQLIKDKMKSVKVEPKQFEEMRALGKGAFGAVFLVFKKDTGAGMAVKKMKKKIGKQNKMLKDILIEREVLSKVNSPFCVSLNYAWQDDADVACVITLMAGGDLEFVMKGRGAKGDYTPMTPEMIKFYTASMALGLEAVHNMGYVYRDLKPMNVLLDGDGLVRVSDMGLCADISKGAIKQCSGTRGYWSPETIQKQPYTTEPDWWSLGVTMFVFYTHKLPFSGSDEEKDAASQKGEIDFAGNSIPADLAKVIGDLCTVDQAGRLKGVDALKKHAYFSGFDWDGLIAGKMSPPFQPNVNEINAPDKKDIDAFVAPKDVTWDQAEIDMFKDWEFFNAPAWEDEAIIRIKKFKELTGGGGGGGGCCTIA